MQSKKLPASPFCEIINGEKKSFSESGPSVSSRYTKKSFTGLKIYKMISMSYLCVCVYMLQ